MQGMLACMDTEDRYGVKNARQGLVKIGRPRTSRVMDFKGEPTSNTLLDQHNS